MQDLAWFISHVEQSDGVYIFDNIDWTAQQADITAYADASMSGMGFYFEHSCEGFQSPLPHNPPKNTIFYFESLAVVSVVEAVMHAHCIPRHLLIFSDNTNMVNIFHSLRSLPPYNDLLKFTVSLLLKFNISLRVVHVSGMDNVVADALSCFENTQALAACLGLSISKF